MATTYVLRSLKDGKLYIGSTKNLEKRISEHNAGKNRSTKSRIPFVIVYCEEFDTISEAMFRERQFKKSHSILYRAAGWDDVHK